MSLNEVPTAYNLTQLALHWGIAALIIVQFVLHDGIVEAWDTRSDGIDPAYTPLAAAQVIGGIIVLKLVKFTRTLNQSCVNPGTSMKS